MQVEIKGVLTYTTSISPYAIAVYSQNSFSAQVPYSSFGAQVPHSFGAQRT